MSAEDKAIQALANDKHKMDKYSRQIGEFGVAAMAKLVQMRVLIISLKGVGIEVAKNLILQGVGEVAIYDEDIVQIEDLGSNFYLKEEHVGKVKRSEACLSQLKSLNPLVKVSVQSKGITNKTVRDFSVVVDCGLSLEEGKVCDEQCRRKKAKTKYIRARVHGLVGYYFSDFGDEFTIVDKTGEQPKTRLIDVIESDPENPNGIIVRLIANKPHMMELDDHTGFIKFDEIKGDLGKILNNTKEAFKVTEAERTLTDGKKRPDPFALKVDIGRKMENINYDEGGQIVQSKQPVSVSYKSLKESLLSPTHEENYNMLNEADMLNFGMPLQLHIALHGLWAFEKETGNLPRPNNEEDTAKVVELAKAYNDSIKEDEKALSAHEVDEKIVQKLAKFSALQFQPLCCFFGGVVAQEVVKYTGKYSPLPQWLHIACFDVLPEENVDEENTQKITPTVDDRKPMGCRYDDLIQIIGRPLHQKLMKSSTFMVGCGALGCELLKNFGLLGLACCDTKEGLITVTDNDNIEISNLSRQFLFREDNVGEPKSLAAGNAVKNMNPDINVKALENLVSPASENIFTADFWEKQDFITNALDNVKARLYVDSQCVYYSKPLLESGTLGVKCNSQVIIPHLSESYADGKDTDTGDAIPMCTLRNFPTEIEHCIEWSRAKFTDLFETDSTKASKFLTGPDEYIKDLEAKETDLSALSTELPSLKRVLEILNAAKNSKTSFESCVEEAFVAFHPLFRDNILALIKAKPEDAKDEDGEAFWGKVKRFPQVGLFDGENEVHLGFVLSMANILSLTYGVVSSQKEFEKDLEKVKKICSGLTAPAEELKEVDLSENAEKKEVAGEDELKEFKKLLAELAVIKDSEDFSSIRIEPASFEKDDDENFHIDFITASSNLRGWNYRMKACPRHKCKMIAGKIIPAIATTTASITGLICIEMLKLIQPGKKLDAFRDTSNTLGSNVFCFMTPNEAKKEKDEHDIVLLEDVKCLPTGFTKWDKTIVKGEGLSVKQFLSAFGDVTEKEYGKRLEITALLHPNANAVGVQGSGKFIYTEDDKDPEELLNSDLKNVVEKIYGEAAVTRTLIRFEVTVCDDEGDMYKVPAVSYAFA